MDRGGRGEGGADGAPPAALRSLPAVERLAAAVEGPREAVTAAAREEVGAARARLLAGADEPSFDQLAAAVRERLRRRAAPRPTAVINATGVILHTNLGRAPLHPEALAAATEVARGYSDLEYDLADGERGSRHAHLAPAIRELFGVETGIAVNNNAAAVLLALAATAAGGEVVIGRDQLVEIGGSFRIPEILAASGAELVEVGTSNRTREADYEAAIGERTAALMRVHQSNFRTVGFTESPSIAELCALGAAHDLPVIDDLGSGAVAPIHDEPVVAASVDAGAELVCFSADKLLGGPQAGLIVGRAAAVERCAAHPLARALRLDKLQLAALEATLRLHRDGRGAEIPALAMLATDEAELERRARRLVDGVGPAAGLGRGSSRPGGGTLPLSELEGPVCTIDPGAAGADELLRRLRAGRPPVVARIAAGRVVLDPRTVADEEVESLIAVVGGALGD